MEPIIKVRLETLKANLSKIQCIFKSVQERRAEISKLTEKLVGAKDDLNTIGYNIVDVLSKTENRFAPKQMDPSLKEFLRLANAATDRLEEKLADATNALSAVQTRWTPIDATFEETFKEDLDDRIGPWLEAIDRNLDALSDAQSENSDQLMGDAWRDLGAITSEQTQLIFSDYVEFLGGLALRDAGLDEGICRIADELMRSTGPVGKTQWAALTIPASQEAETWARSIRMRFPEWTIWAVPLTAHELGRVVTKGSPKFEKHVQAGTYEENDEAKEKARDQMRVYLADAFATYVMGPAYACSVILLRFNPLMAYQEKGVYPPEALRANVVLSTLTKMLEKERNKNPPYGETVVKLKAAWESALVQAKGEPPENLKQEQEKVDQWADHLFRALVKDYTKGMYKGELWNNTAAALTRLLRSENASELLKGTEEWRDVLNAAWLCRIDNVDKSPEIARKANELWQLIQTKKKSPSSSLPKFGYTGSVVPTIQGDRKRGE